MTQAAEAWMEGTAPNQTLNLRLPRGGRGPAGPPTTVSIGTVTTTPAGTSASATMTGSAPNQTLNLTIPQGTDISSAAAIAFAIAL